MDNENKLYELMEKMYVELQETRNEVKGVKSEVQEVKDEVKKTNTTINHDIKPKITALFDGHTQMNSKIDRIETQVSKQEEIIIRKIK